MKAWDDLVSTALLGTAKRGLPETAGVASRPLADAGIEHPDPAGRLLEQAAVLTIYRRAGVLPRRDVAVGESAPGETRPRVSDAAAQRLDGLLADRPGLLPEWLDLCAASGARVPEELLPALLERARTSRAFAARLAPVVGERGRWLAAVNPDWRTVLDRVAADVETQDPAAWETGRRPDRVAYLAALRRTDPAAARELLAEGWTAEAPDDRAEFIAILADGLSDPDEPFLERALDDRRKEIREVAAVFLGRIPTSRYAARMRERIAACVQVRAGGVLRWKHQLEVCAPREVDAAMRRDGVPAKPPARTNEDTGQLWLRELIARTPLAAWSELTGLPPEDVVGLRIDPHENAVRDGWWQAAIRQRDTAWAAALLATWLPGDKRKPGDLLEVLEPERRRTITAGMLDAFPAEDAAVAWIAGCPGPWDVRLGRAVLRSIRELRRHRPFGMSGMRAVLAARMPLHMIADVEALAQQRIDPVTDTLNNIADDLRFRYEMAQELA